MRFKRLHHEKSKDSESLQKKTVSQRERKTFSKTKQVFLGSGIPELKNRIKKPSYELCLHKTELNQIVKSQLLFRNSQTLG